jgi:superfamily II DNA or RNA helicase
MIELYKWQTPEAEHLTEVLQRAQAALEASDTGTGKTYIAAQVAKNLGKTPLVIAPLAVHDAWENTLQQFGVSPLVVINIERLKVGKTPWVRKRNRGKLFSDWSWHLPPKTMVIWDEAHQAGGIDSQNAKLLANLKRYPTIPVLLLSATIADSPLRLLALGYLFGFHEITNFNWWCRTHGCYSSPFARGKLEFPKGKSRIGHLERIHRKIFPEHGGRLRIDDLEDFPDCVVQADAYNLNTCSAIQNVYDELEDQLHDEDNEELPIVLLQRARENIELLKAPLLVELTQNLLEEGKSIVTFFSYRRPAEEYLSRIEHQTGIRPGFLFGGQKKAERQEVIRRFQADEVPILGAMIQAGGISVSLHDLHGNRPRVSLINPPFAVVQLKQALGRIWRAGAKTKAIQKIIFAADTVEEKACDAIRRKLGNLNLLNDGDLVAGVTLEIKKEKNP